ncbi:MAG: DUF2079 domain-containing protein [Actinomycetota bacterium]
MSLNTTTIDEAAEDDSFSARAWPSWLPSPPMTILCVAMAFWMVKVGRLVILRHDKFLTNDFDLGIHDQSLWLLAHFKSWNTVYGGPVFAHHAMFMYIFMVPLVWLGGGPNLWNVMMVAALALTAVPLYALAKRRLDNAWVALVIGIVWLLSPTTSWLAQETFHPEVMALPFLVTGYYLATTRPEGTPLEARRHNILTVLCLLAAMMWKEDIALVVTLMGLALLWRGRRRFGWAVFFGALAYAVVIGAWLVPTLAHGDTAYGMLYGAMGHTPTEVFVNSVKHPTWFAHRLNTNNALSYANRIQAPWAWLGVLSPITLLMAVPQFFINILTTAKFTFVIRYHYQAIPLAVSALAAVEGITWARSKRVVFGHLAVAGLIVSSLYTAVQWGPLSFAHRYNRWDWGTLTVQTNGWQAALDRIGDDTSGVAVMYQLVPHLTHREVVFTYPNPWIRSNYLSSAGTGRSPEKVQWVVVIPRRLGPRELALWNSLIASGEFGDVQTVEGVVSARRLQPPTGANPLQP